MSLGNVTPVHMNTYRRWRYVSSSLHLHILLNQSVHGQAVVHTSFPLDFRIGNSSVPGQESLDRRGIFHKHRFTMFVFTHSLSHLIIHSLCHLLIHSLSHLLIHSLSHLLIHSISNSIIHTLRGNLRLVLYCITQ